MSQAPSSSHDDTQPIYHWLLWIGVVLLAFVQVFIVFRGLDSPAGMDQAQIARELARGNGYTSKMIRPMALQQLVSAGKRPDLLRLADTAQPPVQVLIWAPLFRALESYWPFDTKKRVYAMDRVIASVGVCWLIGSLLLIHGIAVRLFDRGIAVFTVATLMTSFGLWQVASGGSPRALLLFLTCLFMHRLVEAVRRETNGERVGVGLMLLFAVLAGLMTMTHWMAGWLVLGLLVGMWLVLPSARWGVMLGAGVMLLCIGGWAARNLMVGGDLLGVMKAYLLSVLTPEPSQLHMRDLSGALPPAFVGTLLQHLSYNFQDILTNVPLLLVGSLPAMFSVIAMLHRFRNPVVLGMRNITFIAWLGVIVGGIVFGGQKDDVGDEQLHVALVPILTMFGMAALAVLWARLGAEKRTLWSDYGYAMIFIALSGWPMISGLYQGVAAGLFRKDKQAQWPPYMPDRTALLHQMVTDNEIIMTDQPWAVAWYADRSAVWLPKDKIQYAAIVKEAAAEKRTIAGFVITPSSSMEDRLHSQMTGTYAQWSDLIFRGPVLGFGLDIGESLPDPLPFKGAFPLAGSALRDGRLVPSMIFYADRSRWEHLK